MAKPQADKKSEAAASFPAGANYLAPPAYGFAGNPYGSLGAGYGVAAGYQQQVFTNFTSFFFVRNSFFHASKTRFLIVSI